MTKHESAEKLNHLDPGATLIMEAEVLVPAFGASSLTQDKLEEIEAFALEHRCASVYPAGGHRAMFEKDDIF